jgi:hypothetical protein
MIASHSACSLAGGCSAATTADHDRQHRSGQNRSDDPPASEHAAIEPEVL